MSPKHLLQLSDYSSADLQAIIERASDLKARRTEGALQVLTGKHLVLLFSKPSTRTRLSFEVGIRELGGHVIFLPSEQLQLKRGESIEDTARVLSSMSHGIVIRDGDHQNLVALSEHASIPVINALSDIAHPCQVLADMQTYREHRGDIKGRIVTWLGDGNNMCRSYVEAATLFGFELRLGTPAQARPKITLPNNVAWVDDPQDAVRGAHLIVTDTWESMGEKPTAAEQKKRNAYFAKYQLNSALLKLADKDAIYMHCLPAYRDKEISAELMDNPDTVIWEEAENRLHAQKALLEFIYSY